MGECFFWYWLSRVVPTKGRKTVVVVVVVAQTSDAARNCSRHSSGKDYMKNVDVTYENHGNVRESLVSLTDVRQSSLIKKNLL